MDENALAYHVGPRGGGGVLEVGHVRASPAVETVDHLPQHLFEHRSIQSRRKTIVNGRNDNISGGNVRRDVDRRTEGRNE